MEIIIRENPETGKIGIQFFDGGDCTPRELQDFETLWLNAAKRRAEQWYATNGTEGESLKWDEPDEDASRDVLAVCEPYW